MAEFELSHNGVEYKIDAEDEASALKKLTAHTSQKLSPENHPFTKLAIDPARTLAATKTFARNMPIIGNYIPKDEYETQFQKEAPITHGATAVAGAILPAAGAGAALQAPAALSRGAPWLASQTGLAGMLGGADKATQEHSQGQDLNTADILKAMGISGAGSLVGAGASRMITPKPFVPPKSYVPEPPKGNSYEDVLARTRWDNPSNKRTQEQLAELINARRLENAKLAHSAAEPSQLATNAARVVGATMAPHIDPTGGIASKLMHGLWDNRYTQNQIMADPQRAAIMQALLMGGTQQINKIPDVQ